MSKWDVQFWFLVINTLLFGVLVIDTLLIRSARLARRSTRLTAEQVEICGTVGLSFAGIAIGSIVIYWIIVGIQALL